MCNVLMKKYEERIETVDCRQARRVVTHVTLICNLSVVKQTCL
jgi:hypothetical protein